jgi:RimJ/RimL family protein N-acetyltransferase
MLKGTTCTLRTVRESDLPIFQAFMADISNRGDYYPQFMNSEHDVRAYFQEHGYWTRDNGTLLIINAAEAIIGQIEFFKPVGYWNAYEIGYILFDPSERGKGITTEATQLLTRYLFETRHINRIQLQIFPDNAASRRVAEKCGFTREGTARVVVQYLTWRPNPGAPRPWLQRVPSGAGVRANCASPRQSGGRSSGDSSRLFRTRYVACQLP